MNALTWTYVINILLDITRSILPPIQTFWRDLYHCVFRNLNYYVVILTYWQPRTRSGVFTYSKHAVRETFMIGTLAACLYVTATLSWRSCPACRTSLIATRFWVVVICPNIKCLTVLEFSFILIDLCLFITIFNFIFNYVPIVIFWIFTYHKICILLIIFCFIWSYWIIYLLTCLAVF